MRITPPLIDSGMYLFSCEYVCRKWMPACAATSSNCGTGRPVHTEVFKPGGGGGAASCPDWAMPGNRNIHAVSNEHPTLRKQSSIAIIWLEHESNSPHAGTVE